MRIDEENSGKVLWRSTCHPRETCDITNIVNKHSKYATKGAMVKSNRILELADEHGIIRPCDIGGDGKTRQQLARMCRDGELERVGRGLYSLPGRPSSEFSGFAEVAKLVPHGVVCLISALQFHGLTTQISPDVWLMLEGTAKKPKFDNPPLKIMHASGKAFKHGMKTYRVDKVPVKIYSVAKTIADCFKYRNKIGIDVAIEAIREVFKNRAATVDEIWTAAKICRVANVIRPYMEAST